MFIVEKNYSLTVFFNTTTGFIALLLNGCPSRSFLSIFTHSISSKPLNNNGNLI